MENWQNVGVMQIMNKKLEQIFYESIQLELNVAELYKIFNQAFQEDADFWWTLSEEEERHAELIRKAGKIEILPDNIVTEILHTNLQDIIDVNKKIASLIVKYKSNSPSRETAFNVACEVEQSAGELHFQEFMEKSHDNILFQLFQKLNADDKDHFKRLRSYMDEHGIYKQAD